MAEVRYSYPIGNSTGFLTVEETGAKRRCRGEDCLNVIPKGERCLVSIEFSTSNFSPTGRIAVKKSFCRECATKEFAKHIYWIDRRREQLELVEARITRYG